MKFSLTYKLTFNYEKITTNTLTIKKSCDTYQ